MSKAEYQLLRLQYYRVELFMPDGAELELRPLGRQPYHRLNEMDAVDM